MRDLSEPDQQLLDSAQAGNDEAWARLLDRHRGRLRRLAQRGLTPQIRVKHDESDLVQRAIVDAYNARKGFRGQLPVQLRAWLRQILRRQLLRTQFLYHRIAKRNIGRERPLEVAASNRADQTTSVGGQLVRAEDEQRLLAAIARRSIVNAASSIASANRSLLTVVGSASADAAHAMVRAVPPAQ